MHVWEWLTLGYFAWIAAAAWARPLSGARRLQVTGASAAVAAIVVGASSAPVVVREAVVPLLAVLVGYYASGRFALAPSERIERWLMAWDHRWFGDPPATFAAWPRAVRWTLEVLYMACFVLLPAGALVLWWLGRTDALDRYWAIVVATEFGAFAPLAAFETRPPWVIEARTAQSSAALDRLAAYTVRHVSIGANTFPSGHAAGSLGVAFGVLAVSPPVGAVFLGLALVICVGCVSGRYHYAIDVLAGAALAVVAALCLLA